MSCRFVTYLSHVIRRILEIYGPSKSSRQTAYVQLLYLNVSYGHDYHDEIDLAKGFRECCQIPPS